MNILSSLQAWDTSLLELVRSHLILHTSWFPTAIVITGDSEPIAFALFLVGLWLLWVFRKDKNPKYVALDLFWHVMGAFAIYWIINHLLPMRPRPETVTDLPPLIKHFPDNSFPSGHALFWWASWWALAKLTQFRKTTYFFFFLGLLTVITRVVAGIHYPGDIIAGFLLGWFIVQILTSLPHGKRYRKYAHDTPVNFSQRFWL